MARFSETKREIVPNNSHPLDRGRKNRFGTTAFAVNPNVSALPVPEKGVHRRSCDVDDLLDIIHICLKGYQSYFEQVDGDDPFILEFPFAWKLEVGDKVINLTKNAVYTIESHPLKDTRQVVRLVSGSGAPAPDPKDILELDFDNSKIMNFQHAYPASDDTHRYFTDEKIEENSSEPMVDTITYEFTMRPLERGRAQGVAMKDRRVSQLNSQLKDQIVNPEAGTVKNVFINSYEVDLCFTCWSSTQQRTVLLAKWFRIFMRRYRPILITNGAHEIWFVEQKKSLIIDRWRNDIEGRSLEYRAVIQEPFTVDDPMLRSFESYLQTHIGSEAQRLTSAIDIEKQGD